MSTNPLAVVLGIGPAYDVLNQVSNVLVGIDTGQAEVLWAVLTALRGPDFDTNTDNYKLKLATTAVIRYTLARRSTFRHPDTAVDELRNNCGVAILQDNEDLAQLRMGLHGDGGAFPTGQYHFIHHAKQAFIALGLKWNEVNP